MKKKKRNPIALSMIMSKITKPKVVKSKKVYNRKHVDIRSKDEYSENHDIVAFTVFI